MVVFGERFAILVPSIFFYLIGMMSEVEIMKLALETASYIKKSDKVEAGLSSNLIELKDNFMGHHLHSIYLEFHIASIANGLSLIFVFSEKVLGLIFILVSFILSHYGNTITEFAKKYRLFLDPEQVRVLDHFNLSYKLEKLT